VKTMQTFAFSRHWIHCLRFFPPTTLRSLSGLFLFGKAPPQIQVPKLCSYARLFLPIEFQFPPIRTVDSTPRPFPLVPFCSAPGQCPFVFALSHDTQFPLNRFPFVPHSVRFLSSVLFSFPNHTWYQQPPLASFLFLSSHRIPHVIGGIPISSRPLLGPTFLLSFFNLFQCPAS